MASFLFSRLLDGSVYFYINQRFIILTLLAAGGFILVGASLYRQPKHTHHEENHEGHAHDNHNHSHLTWAGLLIILLPLVLGWLVPPKPLGANAFGNRENKCRQLAISRPPPGENERMGLISGEKNIIDWLIDIQNSVLTGGVRWSGSTCHWLCIPGWPFKKKKKPIPNSLSAVLSSAAA